MPQTEQVALEQVLRFNPRWWWDPVPDWILSRLDREGVLAMATTHLDVHKAVLEAQAKAIDATRAILTKHLEK